MKARIQRSQFQHPTPTSREGACREIPNTKHSTGIVVRHWNWKLGASLVLGGWCLVLLLCPAAHAQTYSIDWSTIDGGGGTSTGGVYSISGTVGQPDAGTMSGGSYSLAGGFWGIISAIQTPGAPLLTVLRTPTNAVLVTWPSPSTGFALQQVGNLNLTNWSAPSESITDNGTNKFIIVSPPTGNRFYRLLKP